MLTEVRWAVQAMNNAGFSKHFLYFIKLAEIESVSEIKTMDSGSGQWHTKSDMFE